MKKALITIILIALSTVNTFAVTLDELQEQLDAAQTEIDAYTAEAKESLVDRYYPVGSIYISTEDLTEEDASELFGGEWVRITNRFLWASADGEAGSLGGKRYYDLSILVGAEGNEIGSRFNIPSTLGISTFSISGIATSVGVITLGAIPVIEGSSRSVDMIPPFLAVRMFRRVA